MLQIIDKSKCFPSGVPVVISPRLLEVSHNVRIIENFKRLSMSTASVPNPLALLNPSLPIGSLEAYVHRVNQIPLLSEEEEKGLTQQLYEHGDLEAARLLIMAHLRYVVSVARKYAGYGLPQADLIQEGNIGLMKAVKRFNPEAGVRLVSFAVHWIKAEIHEFILKNWKIVKVATTKAQRKLFFNLRKSLSQHLGWVNQKKATEISKQLNVTEKDVFVMASRLGSHDESLETVNSGSEAYTSFEAESLHSNPAFSLEKEEWDESLKCHLKEALEALDSRSYDIVHRRWLSAKEDKPTLADLAQEYGISLERVRQIEKAAMKKIKQFVTQLMPKDQLTQMNALLGRANH